MNPKDGHVRVLPVSVANKIAAGEVIERPASVVKELVENAIDAGATDIRIAVAAGGRKLVSVRDDGKGMDREDALMSLERQATSKITDVSDIENIGTLGFRGEAIPSIASVSRFTLTTRTRDNDEGTAVRVDAGVLAEAVPAGCPPGTLVEVKDLFCNVPARLKFMRSQATEEGHIRNVFTQHALAHPEIGFTLVFDGREIYRLAGAASAKERVRELFGRELVEDMLELDGEASGKAPKVSGFIERPNLSTPTRRDQYIFVNSRPASSASIAYAIREAYPGRTSDVRPAAVIFIDLPASEVDVNVHPAKREVRFRNNAAVKAAVAGAIEKALSVRGSAGEPAPAAADAATTDVFADGPVFRTEPRSDVLRAEPDRAPAPAPVPMEFPVESGSSAVKPWRWFRFLAGTESGYLLIETDAGVVTVNPHAAHERIAFERLMQSAEGAGNASQTLLIPETVELPPVDFARIRASIDEIRSMGFALEEFGRDTFKIDAVPQIIGSSRPGPVIATIARDLSEIGARRGSMRWKEELIARSIARSFAGSDVRLDEKSAVRLMEELASCRMPYVTPRGKPVMIFTSTRELERKFNPG